MPESQSLKNHRRLVPTYHIGVLSALLVYIIFTAYRFAMTPGLDTAINLIVSLALMVLAISLRSQILRVQDRLIRLEMRLRMQQLLPQDLRNQIDRIGVKQLVALRFASDAELPELTRQVLSGSLTTQSDIKARIRDWQGDFLRA
jgi:hypothetical protein